MFWKCVRASNSTKTQCRRTRKCILHITFERNRRESGSWAVLCVLDYIHFRLHSEHFFPLKSQGEGALHLPESSRGWAKCTSPPPLLYPPLIITGMQISFFFTLITSPYNYWERFELGPGQFPGPAARTDHHNPQSRSRGSWTFCWCFCWNYINLVREIKF